MRAEAPHGAVRGEAVVKKNDVISDAYAWCCWPLK